VSRTAVTVPLPDRALAREPAPPPEHIVVSWGAAAVVIELLPHDPPSVVAAAEALLEGARRRLADAEARAAQSPERQEADTRAKALADARQELPAAQGKAAQMLAAAREALDQGEPAAKLDRLDQAAEQAERRAATLSRRAEQLARLAAETERRAERAGASVLAGARAELVAGLAGKRQAALGVLYQSMGPALAEVLAHDLALDALQRQ
jgi:hypothetical protein